MRSSLYRRSLIVTITIALLFSVVGMLAMYQVRRFDRERVEFSPAVFSGRLIDQMRAAGVDAHTAIEILQRAEHYTSRPHVQFITGDEAKRLLKPGEVLPSEVYGSVQVSSVPMHNAAFSRIVKLAGPEEYYLLASFGEHRSRLFTTTFGVLAVSVVFASLASISLVFLSLRKRAEDVTEVISRLKAGDLKARLSIRRIDESTHIMTEFNTMADEIERLVEKIKVNEGARMEFFRELTHDLRTPVASLKQLLETLSLRSDSLSSEVKAEFLTLSLKEVDYFGRLIDDLLFLAQVTEPKYRPEIARVDLVGVLNDELDRVLLRAQTMDRPLEGKRIYLESQRLIAADEHLLRRLIRNALENASSFARSEITIEVRQGASQIEIFIRDDGTGFSEDALRTFGEKRGTRVLGENKNGRLSVGLGSVVMSAVAAAHDGSLKIRNLETGGAEVRVTLPADQGVTVNG